MPIYIPQYSLIFTLKLSINLIQIQSGTSKMEKKQLQLKEEEYQLKVVLDENGIDIQLWVLEPIAKLYQRSLRDDSLPSEIKQIFVNCAILFDCLKDRNNNRVLSKQGKIQIQNTIKYGSGSVCRTVVRTQQLQLYQQQTTQSQIIAMRIASLSDTIHNFYHIHPSQTAIQFTQSQVDVCQIHNSSKLIEQGIKDVHADIDALNKIFDESKFYQQLNEWTNIYQHNKQMLRNFRNKINQIQKEHQIFIPHQVSDQQEKTHRWCEDAQKKQIQIFGKSKNAFTFQDNILTYVGKYGKWTHVFVNQQYNYSWKNKNSYTAKILNCDGGDMYIGFAKFRKDQKTRKHDSMSYYGSEGQVWTNRQVKIEGPGFATGKTVEVKLLSTGVQWHVDGILAAKLSVRMLKENVYVPYIECAVTHEFLELKLRN